MHETLECWEETVEALIRRQTRTEAGFNRVLSAVTKEVAGKGAYNKQLQCMKNTKKPFKMSCTDTLKMI